jgi:proteic killer suppression protein
VIRTFKDGGSEDLYNGVNSKAARKICPTDVIRTTRRKLLALEAAKTLEDLKGSGYGLEKLKGDREGQYAIRINQQYRVCFVWKDHGADQVEVTDYH